MRIWSIHPSFLDSKGLVALWRETLLAKHVLEGKTKGYRNHPQLERFKEMNDPLMGINFYLQEICEEASHRNFNFDKSKFEWVSKPPKLEVTEGQLEYEKNHLFNKLKIRDPEQLLMVEQIPINVHPLFEIVKGPIASWEKI